MRRVLAKYADGALGIPGFEPHSILYIRMGVMQTSKSGLPLYLNRMCIITPTREYSRSTRWANNGTRSIPKSNNSIDGISLFQFVNCSSCPEEIRQFVMQDILSLRDNFQVPRASTRKI